MTSRFFLQKKAPTNERALFCYENFRITWLRSIGPQKSVCE